ncbi:penicillin-binding protein 2 [Rhizobiales bacterium L72]|uniref:Penicillin-binding protein 2 n=2 Tax=Propylenella binzhouense TaxID=2555902 RepID=A0A964WT93_9HYPH|nr:penicillin-binding protein 2 [Propylenella binzhouense]MYZ47797.1 penicillin-binding protein 2 [Propylenella binzhouense]
MTVLGVASADWQDGTGSFVQSAAMSRPDIVDRNGEILATDIKTASLYAEPRRIVDPDEATEKLASVFPDLDRDRLRRQLSTRSAFLYLKREVTPRQQQAIHQLGIPGIGFRVENKRFYPGGATAGHILGAVNVDNQGIAGIERYIDTSFLKDLQAAGFASERGLEPFRLSVDLRVQHAIRTELVDAMAKYHAKAAVGIVMNVRTGEVVGMSSVPDYDSNDRSEVLDKDRMNRATVGVFEMGSTFKGFTTALALDSGAATIHDTFDATSPLAIAGFRIHDFHGKHRWLSVPEVFIYSSNIGTGRMVLKAGTDLQHDYFERFGFLSELRTELPESGAPIVPKLPWSKISSVTMAFGHGISVSPLQTAAAGVSLINGGVYIPPTFLPRSEEEAMKVARRVLKPETSDYLRHLFRLNVLKGSGRNASVAGYRVGGKTGTAEKVVNGRYSNDKRRNAFLAGFPMDAPKYLVLVVIDEPEPEKPGIGATAGLNAAPMVSGIIRRIAPMLGVEPLLVDPEEEPAMALAFAR